MNTYYIVSFQCSFRKGKDNTQCQMSDQWLLGVRGSIQEGMFWKHGKVPTIDCGDGYIGSYTHHDKLYSSQRAHSVLCMLYFFST